MIKPIKAAIYSKEVRLRLLQIKVLKQATEALHTGIIVCTSLYT